MNTWMDDHPYVLIYLIGCVVAAMSLLTKLAIVWAINWITKTNILNRNLRKVLAPEANTMQEKALLFGLVLVAETLLSWINVPIAIWQIASVLLRAARDQLQSTPEAIKSLRFPLKNNPNMSRESVWAYLTALNLQTGIQPPSDAILVDWLDEVHGYYPSFDRVAALKHLESLKVLDSNVTSATLARVDSAARAALDQEDETDDSVFDESTAVLVEDDIRVPHGASRSRPTGTYSGTCERCSNQFSITLNHGDKTVRCPECFQLSDASSFRPQGTTI